MKIAATTNIDVAALNKALAQYAQLRKMSARDVLTKQMGKLAREVKHQLFATSPAKGEITNLALAKIKAGRMIKVRTSIRESVLLKDAQRASKALGKKTRKTKKKRLTVSQEMVRAELAMRERGRKVMGVSSKYPSTVTGSDSAMSRYGVALSRSTLSIGESTSTVGVEWEGVNRVGASVLEGFSRSVSRKAVETAIANTTADIMVYVEKKAKEVADKTMRTMIPK